MNSSTTVATAGTITSRPPGRALKHTSAAIAAEAASRIRAQPTRRNASTARARAETDQNRAIALATQTTASRSSTETLSSSNRASARMASTRASWPNISIATTSRNTTVVRPANSQVRAAATVTVAGRRSGSCRVPAAHDGVPGCWSKAGGAQPGSGRLP